MGDLHRAITGGDIDPEVLNSAEKVQRAGWKRRDEVNGTVRSLKSQGNSIKGIVRATGVSRQTVRLILAGTREDVFRSRSTSLDRWADKLCTEWNGGCRNGAELWRRLRDAGYGGSQRVVTEEATRRRRAAEASADRTAPVTPMPPVVLTAGQVVVGLQQVASRNTDSLNALVVSATQIHGGDAYNVIPNEVVVRGTVRALAPTVRASAERALRRIVEGICASTGAASDIRYERQYPTLVNSEQSTLQAVKSANYVRIIFDTNSYQTIIVEYSAFMLEWRDGHYAWIRNVNNINGCMLQSVWFNLNDDALSYGASYFAKLVEGRRN